MALYLVIFYYYCQLALIEERYADKGGSQKQQQQDYGSSCIPILHAKDIFKSFNYNAKSSGKNVFDSELTHNVLSGIELIINEGEFVTIVGPSGCGKTTLLNILAGFDKPDSGSVIIKGIHDLPSTKRILIFQEGALFPWLNARDNVEFGLRIANMPEEQRQQIAEKYIEIVGLTKFSESFVYQLSGGMKQRVAIARALAMEPEILLMDEPFASLDIQTRDLLHEKLVGIHKTTRKTILFVTHNINEAILLGDRVIVMSALINNIRKEFFIELPRPRDPENPVLLETKRQILNEFEGELQLAKRK
jgi:NitT/TauT family transport system ATP-binding protein